jgi:NitT/TauT family transport system substrate-binding protein
MEPGPGAAGATHNPAEETYPMQFERFACRLIGAPALVALMSFALATLANLATAAEPANPPVVRVGVLQFGTVNWELDLIARQKLAEREGVRIQVVQLAQKDAANVAIQGGAVDVIATDWLWVARQRSDGRDYVFSPHSTAVGSILVKGDSGLRNFADLKGKRLGVAGGPVDKSWLLLRAWSRKHLGEDAANVVQPDFVAPPLLNQLALRGEMPAALNFWHFAARLKAAGWRELLSMPDLLAGLGLDRSLPMVGWVFSERWAKQNPAAIEGFLRASAAAKKQLADNDAVWEEIRPLTRAEDTATLLALREAYRAGIAASTPAAVKAAEKAAAAAFPILAREGGKEVVGNATQLAPGVFWPGRDGR